jgi:ribonucleoside-diphosphate reductase alpha chain
MAIMFTESIFHPDIIKFINAKHGDTEEAEENRISNANMSVVVDDKFMNAVKNGETFWTEFNGVKYQEYDAKTVYDLIIDGAWRNGEPGILFQDAINKSPYYEVGQEIFGTNPCSEQPLPPNGVCNLGSLDIAKFLNKDKEIDWEKLELATRLSVEFLDNVIDKTTYPTKEIGEWSLTNRPIGLGIMAYADYLLVRKTAYGSERAIEELEKILGFIYDIALDESEKRGKNLGIPTECAKLSNPRRNITILTIAPTGTISLIAGCSSGIEPIFSEITIRNDKTGSYTFENDLADKDYFRCAVSSNGGTEVTWEEHIQTLAAAQRHVDSGVSKTINFPKMTHRDTMAKAGMLAWELGCKGVAMYRNESRKVQVLTPKALKKDKCPVCGNELVEISGKRKCLGCKSEIEQNTSPAYDL